MQRVNAVVRFIRAFYFAPGIEEILGSKQRSIFVVHTIANYNKSIIPEDVRDIPAITNSQLCKSIHDSGVCLHGALEFQHHYRQTIHINNAIRNTLLCTFYLQLVYYLEDIPLRIPKVNHFNEQIWLRSILTLDGEALSHQPIRLRILNIERCAIISS